MIPLPVSANPIAPTHHDHDAFGPQFLLTQLNQLLEDGPAYVQRSARSMIDRLISEWSLDAEPAPQESNPEEEEEPL